MVIHVGYHVSITKTFAYWVSATLKECYTWYNAKSKCYDNMLWLQL